MISINGLKPKIPINHYGFIKIFVNNKKISHLMLDQYSGFPVFSKGLEKFNLIFISNEINSKNAVKVCPVINNIRLEYPGGSTLEKGGETSGFYKKFWFKHFRFTDKEKGND